MTEQPPSPAESLAKRLDEMAKDAFQTAEIQMTHVRKGMQNPDAASSYYERCADLEQSAALLVHQEAEINAAYAGYRALEGVCKSWQERSNTAEQALLEARERLTDLIGGPDHRLGGEDNPEAKDTAPLSIAINFGKLRRARSALAHDVGTGIASQGTTHGQSADQDGDASEEWCRLTGEALDALDEIECWEYQSPDYEAVQDALIEIQTLAMRVGKSIRAKFPALPSKPTRLSGSLTPEQSGDA